MGALPGLKEWWPIKAYRPCPSLQGAGMNYSRYVASQASLFCTQFGIAHAIHTVCSEG